MPAASEGCPPSRLRRYGETSRRSSPSASGGGWSGRRGSNPRPTAWKAVTLPLSYSRPSTRFARSGQASARLPSSSTALVLRSLPPTPPRRARRPKTQEGRVRTSVARWAADLQSAAIDRSATSPLSRRSLSCWSPCFRRVPEDPLRTMNSGAGGGRGSLRWSWRRDLNPRPADYKSAALPD
jgi:hypothetical protein